MFKRIQFHSKFVIAIFGLLFTSTLFAASNIPLVLDAENKAGLPRNYRTTNDLSHLPKGIDTTGLSQLLAIGSAEFSEKQLETVLQKHKLPLTIVDLRQESHGFVNGNAISWYAKHDWGNLGKTDEQVEQDQKAALNTVASKKEMVINTIEGKNKNDTLQLSQMTSPVSQVMTEAEIAKRHHLGYIRIYVTDNWPPADREVDRFVNFERNLPKDTTLYFHCRAGKGRTTTFMVMHDMMDNAKQVSFENIILRQYQLGGINLLREPGAKSYKNKLAQQRVKFIKDFYQYTASNKDNFKTTWSQWKLQQEGKSR